MTTSTNQAHDLLLQIEEHRNAIKRLRAERIEVRKSDTGILMEEAEYVGFEKGCFGVNDNKVFSGVYFEVRNDSRTVRSFGRGENVFWGYELDDYGSYERCQPDDFTPAQRFFLDWARKYRQKFEDYWNGLTTFSSIREVIDDMKENFEPRLSKDDDTMYTVKGARNS